MKKVFILFVFITGLCASKNIQAQTYVGGFLGFGSKVNQPGLGGVAEVGIADRWALSPSLLFYFPESSRVYTFSWFEFNLNMNYYLYNQGTLNLYGLGGLNWHSFSG